MTEKEIRDFIQEWVDLYPVNIEFAGYNLKSPAKDCVNKMIKFCKDNPTFTKDLIFAATKHYLQEQEVKDWQYTKRATYFISKLGEPSLLESYCTRIIEQGSKPKANLPPIQEMNGFI